MNEIVFHCSTITVESCDVRLMFYTHIHPVCKPIHTTHTNKICANQQPVPCPTSKKHDGLCKQTESSQVNNEKERKSFQPVFCPS